MALEVSPVNPNVALVVGAFPPPDGVGPLLIGSFTFFVTLLVCLLLIWFVCWFGF
jgi:hypothetical protein